MKPKSKITQSMFLSAAALVAMLSATVSPASAISRIETTKNNCSDIRAALIHEGEAILRHTSKRGLPIYDRYVSSSLMCESPSIGVWASVPARDTNSCRVIRCDPTAADYDEDSLFKTRPLLRLRP
ncbi:hypothetical protein [uncultured Hoeflea sp.]|uniref:hypothetical protein n=1 Tax=uncultured Hoeflea sp. TaxID=538666 RepID=UPI0030DD6B4F|tara:strand:+ start:2100 stop:2477 length:378 start_codon:yes stop_codon:yes gene_type:complete